MIASCVLRKFPQHDRQSGECRSSAGPQFLSSGCATNRNIFVMSSPETTNTTPALKRRGVRKASLLSGVAARMVALVLLVGGLAACGFLPPPEVFRAEFWSTPADPPVALAEAVGRPSSPSDPRLPRPEPDPRMRLTGRDDPGSDRSRAPPGNRAARVEGHGMVQPPATRALPVPGTAQQQRRDSKGALPAQASPVAPASTSQASRQRLSLDGPAVHLGSYRTRAEALRAWPQLSRAFPDLLSGLQPDIREVAAGADGRAIWRLIAGTMPDPADAAGLCQELTRQHQFCRPLGNGSG